ncbi:Hypothetical predicted protein [Mytilus galloprovincialis]|uniref:Myb/SANT-like DNA-binding domain-containing protein n=1 Tax=Mytilus galloprovincialis TaxID=29158 RepID=A0A8B6CU19_MYTGA|nr:Hypothetical predicted protein [Mytilus galloprovincialis]
MEEAKKTKKPRFTEKKIYAIVDNVKENSVMLFSKFSDAVSNTRKKEAWKKVQNAVNAVSFTSRTIEEIKKKWDDIKRGTKKKATSITNEWKKTGGGVPSFIALSKMEEDVVAVVGEERVFGISTGCDTMKTPMKASCAETAASAVMPPFGNATGSITHVLYVDHTRQTPKRPTESENNLPVKQKKTDSESLILQRKHVEIEEQRLIIERERLAIEKRRLFIEEKRFESAKRQEIDNDGLQEPTSFEVFRGAFMSLNSNSRN